jgi:hypothetical protein
VAKVVERIRPHYEVHDVEFGKVYRWRPETIVVECRCGRRLSLTASTTCSCVACGSDHTDAFRAESVEGSKKSDETLHPWRYSEDREEEGIPY